MAKVATRKLTTICAALALLGIMAGCGSSKPASPSAAATKASAESPLSQCVQSWNNGSGGDTSSSGRNNIGTEAYYSHVATVAIYVGQEMTYLSSAGSIHPGACMVIAGYSVWIQMTSSLWEIGPHLASGVYFRSFESEAETWSVNHANVRVAPELLPSEPESENNGKLTAMDGQSPFQMTAEDVGHENYTEKQETTPRSSTPEPSTAPTSSQSIGKPCPSNGLQIRGEELPSGAGTIEDTTSIGITCSGAIKVVKTWIELKPKGEAGNVSGYECTEAKGENNHSFTVACSNGVKRVAFRVEEPH